MNSGTYRSAKPRLAARIFAKEALAITAVRVVMVGDSTRYSDSW